MSKATEQGTHLFGRLARHFYEDRRLIALTLLLALASGLSSLAVLPRMEDPLLTQRAANIVTLFPGADANRVEALVTEKIEDRLLDVPEIKRMRSQSRAGSSFISIELRDEVTETGPIWSNIRGKLEDSIASLPAGANRPKFQELDIAAYAWIGALVWTSSSPVSESVLRRLARELKDELFAVAGTKEVDLYGDPLEEIVVEIDSDRVASLGLSAADIADQLRRGDVKSSAGLIHGQKSEIVVELRNQFRSMEDILNATLVASAPGRTLRLSDVATVSRRTPEPAAARAIIDGRPGIVVSVMLRPEFRIDHWARAAQPVLESFRQQLSSGIEMDVIMRQDNYVSLRMLSLARNIGLGVAAVAVVTFLFMGWRSSLLVTGTLPVAACMVLAAMRYLEIPIHQMSITGLIIALGLLIDNAIIAADEIDLSLRRGFTPANAVYDMVSRLFAPLLASTATTALAFAPIALMEGPAGEFVGSIAITVMLAIFSSLFLAMTVLPATAAWLQSGLVVQPNQALIEYRPSETVRRFVPPSLRRLSQHGMSFPSITRVYGRFLSALVHRPWTGIVLGSLLPIMGFMAAGSLSEQFFPPADRDQFHIELELAASNSLFQTEQLAKQVDAVLLQHPRIRHTAWFLGESAPPFYYNIISRRKNSPNYGQAIVTLDSNRSSLELIREIQTELDSRFPTARLLVRQLEQGPPFDAPVEVRLFGSDLEQLKQFGEILRAVASRIPDVLHTRTALSDTRPVASIDVSAERANWVGLSEPQIADQLYARLEGLPAGAVIEGVEEVPVRVRVDQEHRHRVEELEDASLFVSSSRISADNSDGSTSEPILRAIPVASIADIHLDPQRAVITRYNGRRVNEVQAFITAGKLPSDILHQLEQRIAASDFELPSGFSLEIGGEASERNAAVGRLMANVSVLAVGIVASLVLALRSFRQTALIGLVAMLSIGLGLGALWLFNYPFGFMAIVGTMGLVGIAINDSIVVVSALASNPRVRAGDAQALVDTVIEVSRHVLATTATTVVGFLPLLLSGGGFWPPLAIAVGAGVTGATLISLTLVPCAFCWMVRARPYLEIPGSGVRTSAG